MRKFLSRCTCVCVCTIWQFTNKLCLRQYWYESLTARDSATNLTPRVIAASLTSCLLQKKQISANGLLTEIQALEIKRAKIPSDNLLSNRPPVLSSNSGATESPESVAAVTLSLENCSCSQATYDLSILNSFKKLIRAMKNNWKLHAFLSFKNK